ncbi:MAG: hypothetical protein JW819_12415 [Candidatus Krumholzibacteriota bacterium]|nr:hypothetical protein [Candidatus Krumholzibacteriota bacterium]
MNGFRTPRLTVLFTLALLMPAALAGADVDTPVPPAERGRIDAERRGFHDANNMRTEFWNYGMVGNYPPDPGNVDLSVFHSVEVPKGSGMNYSDGITPFVLARITTVGGNDAYIMETGFRERQGTSPYYNRVMRFEPRPGYFEPDPDINKGQSCAVSSDPRTWPGFWPDRLDETDDPGWPESWNGYFGKQIVADQESYTVMDDDFYDAWQYYPDSRDSSRRGLGLRIEVRGFQWANPQARNVIFWHYDITNESTTDYDDNIIFGLYMDSGVGGSALSCDGIYESDDDNAFFDRTFNEDVINLVYTWDRFGHGCDLSSTCGRTGYLGYAYMETPGNSTDGVDNDEDGVTDELREGGEGILLTSQAAIEAYVAANYDPVRFETTYGPLADRPAYREEYWWTGDEDMDWTREQHDTGADGVFETGDVGEGDGVPTAGEPNFDRTDLNESDQIGLTGFKINRIRPGQGNPNQEVDAIVFFTDEANWPQRLYEKFTDPDPEVRFDPPLASNYNIGFLFASGPFRLAAGQRERFSLALAFGADLDELRRTVRTVQQIYNANYRFAVPPALPTLTAEEGDGYVRLSWDDVAEFSADPVTGEYDFEGYRIYRSTDVNFRDPQVITTGTGTGPLGNGKPIAQFDLVDGRSGFSTQVVEGVAYYLGTESGITHTWTDYSVTNGQEYYYAVTAYDYGSDPGGQFDFYPSENTITARRTPRAGLDLETNVVAVRPNPRAAGYVPAEAEAAVQVSGRGVGTVLVDVVNSGLVPDGHLFKIDFQAPSADSLRASRYSLRDSTTGELFFETGTDLDGEGTGPVGQGLLPVVFTQAEVAIDSSSGFAAGSATDAVVLVSYLPTLPSNRLRPGYPDDISIIFADTVQDTGLAVFPFFATPARFRVIANGESGPRQLDFRFRDVDGDSTLSHHYDVIDIVTYLPASPDTIRSTWSIALDPDATPPLAPPREGDRYELRLTRPYGEDDSFVFTSVGETIDGSRVREEFMPYVVPNPYVGSASFEPERFAVSGRGERRLEFRGLPSRCVIRIFNVKGERVQTLRHDGSHEGYLAWDLRTKEGLDVAPGLYIFQVDGGAEGRKTGKFAIIK